MKTNAFTIISALLSFFVILSDASELRGGLAVPDNAEDSTLLAVNGDERKLAVARPDCDVSYPELVGDGICHSFGNYNTPECNWDGGDCCQDSCVAFGCGRYLALIGSPPRTTRGVYFDCKRDLYEEETCVLSYNSCSFNPSGTQNDCNNCCSERVYTMNLGWTKLYWCRAP